MTNDSKNAQASADLIAELRPVAYLTPENAMLFFDRAEAQTYCDDDADPEPLAIIPKE